MSEEKPVEHCQACEDSCVEVCLEHHPMTEKFKRAKTWPPTTSEQIASVTRWLAAQGLHVLPIEDKLEYTELKKRVKQAIEVADEDKVYRCGGSPRHIRMKAILNGDSR